jgi:AcrR family transcriptional regulator
LLEAARARFARYGFERTSLRDIAADAGVDQALVIRYFGSKEKLFAAACSPEPKTYGVFSGPREELAERLLDWVVSIEGGDGEGQFVNLLQSSSDQAATRLLQQRLDKFTNRLASEIDAPNAQVRAELITAWLLGIAAMSRIARRPALIGRTARDLGPYLLPAMVGLAGGRTGAVGPHVRIDHSLHS